MTRLLLGLLSVVALLAACAPSSLSQRELVGGVFVVGYQAAADDVVALLATRGPSVQPNDAYGFLNLASRSGSAVVLSARRLGGVGQIGNEAAPAEISVQASVEQEGALAIVTVRGEPALSGAVADARREIVELLDSAFERADLPPADGS